MHNINTILRDHARYLRGEEGGKKADLSNANLRSANLRSANLSGADLSGADLLVIHINQYTAYVQKDYTRIGCQFHSNEDWLSFSSREVGHFSREAVQKWEKYGGVIKQAIRSIQAS